MENNVGKLKLVLLIVVANVATSMSAFVDLRVTAIDGSALHQAAVGRPFLITVTIAGGADSEPKIEGLNQLHLVSRSNRIATINGRTTVDYGYQVYGDTVGDFTIGPAIVEIAGSAKQSGSRIIHIAQQEKSDKTSNIDQEATLQMSVDKSHAVVGERIRCKVQFAGVSDKVQLQNIIKPHFDVALDATSEPVTRTEQKNGISWTTTQMTFELRPQKAGKLVIPACSAEFAVEKEVNDQLSIFAPFFRYRNELRKIYSNAATIIVDELPVTSGTIQAVGTFDYLRASLKPAVAKEGEGMVLTLELKGDAPTNAVETPQLQHMPSALKWYESKHYGKESETGGDHTTLCFEYVVQGMQQGSWEISPQSFTYFDVKTRSVKTIKSMPIIAVIQPNGARFNSPQTAQPEKNNAVDPHDELSPLITDGNWQSSTAKHMPWTLFFIIACIPLLWALWKALQLYLLQMAPYFTHRLAFQYARKQVKIAARTGAGDQLLSIFVTAIAVRSSIAPSLISQEIIETKLAAAGMDTQKIKAFDSFMTTLHELSFCKGQFAPRETIFAQADQWLYELEKIL